jgi:hypothetical protein
LLHQLVWASSASFRAESLRLQEPCFVTTATGNDGTISFDGTILNQRVQGTRHILARAVTAIEFRKPAGGEGNGFIAFDCPGHNPPRGGVFDALADENAVVFNQKVRNDFADLLKAVRRALRTEAAALHRSAPIPTVPPPEPTSPPPIPQRLNAAAEGSSAWLDEPSPFVQ